MALREYRCTRNFLYSDDDLVTRQGHYVHAHSKEEAWQIMASRYPQETAAGFTVQEWHGGEVKIVEVQRDSQGNVICPDSN